MSVSKLIQAVADSTAHRDREQLDQSVARLLAQFLDARYILLRWYGQEGAEVVPLREFTLDLRGSRLSGNSLRDTASDQQLLDDSLKRQAVVESVGDEGLVRTVFPIQTPSGDLEALLLVETPASLASRDSQLVGGILRIVRNHLAVLEYGERDSLTGFLNRKTFEERFDKLRQGLQIGGAGLEPPSHSFAALIDIDHFKSINDRFGHLFGDEVLLLVSRQLRRAVRRGDTLYRYGGEEFVLLLRDAVESDAQQVFERLRRGIQDHAFPQIERVTISLGWTRILAHDGPTTCLERADAALYQAKNSGRNRIMRYESPAAVAAAKAEDLVELF